MRFPVVLRFDNGMIRFICCFAVLLLSSPALWAQSTWKAGAASVVITPTKLQWMAGYGSRTAPAEGTQADLYAKALALEDAAGRRGLILTLDLVGIDGDLAGRIASELEKQYGLTRDMVAINTSHTHSGPALPGGLAPLHYYLLDPEQQKLCDEYEKELFAKIVAASGEALKSLAPARLQWGSGLCDFAVNRRNNPEKKVEELRQQGLLKGPVDHDVPVLAVRAEDGTLRSVLFGYACHCTTLSGQVWDADYPGYARKALEESYPGGVALFFAGCGADQNPLPRRELALAKKYGADLAARITDVLNSPMSELPPILTNAYRAIPAPLDPVPSKEDLEAATQNPNKYEAARARYLLDRIKKNGPLTDSYPYPIGVWGLGSQVDLVFLGGEVVVDYALRLKAERRGRATWVAGYSNDVMAYIPSLRVLREGGYEGGKSNVYYGLPALWHESIEETIVSAVHEIGGVRGYPDGVMEIHYPVPEDKSEQPALYWKPEVPAGVKVPLLVALHTWSDSYLQAGGEAKYAEWCMKNGWAFIHPNFRGPNSTPEAMGSDLVIADIRAAVEWAKANAPIDEERIYAIGTSGGGHLAELVAGRLPEIWAGVSAWCGISDIAAWHTDTTAAKRGKYAANIESALGGAPNDSEELRKAAAHRSPITWLKAAGSVPLDINHGIEDGRKGSVPFVHSLRAFNAVVQEADRIPEETAEAWYAAPESIQTPEDLSDSLYGKNSPIYRKTSGNTRVTLFQGGHEIIHGAALNWLAAQRKGQPANWNPTTRVRLETTAAEQASGK